MSDAIIGALIGLAGAVLGVAVGAVVALRTHRSSESRETVGTFRELLDQLIQLRADNIELNSEYADAAAGDDPAAAAQRYATHEALSATLNARRGLLKASARQMLDRLSGVELLPKDLLTLGYELELDSDSEGALDLYTRALEMAGTDVGSRIEAHRVIGSLLLSAPMLRDVGAGERHFASALEESRGKDHDYMRYTTGYTLETWGYCLLSAGHPGGHERLAQAREAYEGMSPANPLRAYALRTYDSRRASAGADPSTTRLLPPRLATDTPDGSVESVVSHADGWPPTGPAG